MTQAYKLQGGFRPMDPEKLRVARENKDRTNCCGTALYLMGQIPKDELVDGSWEKHFSKMKKLDSPEVDSYLLFLYEYQKGRVDVWHAAIITNLSPLLITHRPSVQTPEDGEMTPLEENDNPTRYFNNSRPSRKHFRFEYRMPVDA